MIAIKINNQYLDLPQTISISFEQISPLFKESAMATNYSYPIEIPLTANNKNILGFLDRPDVAKDFEVLPCQISYKGVELIVGTLNITSIDNSKATAFILEYSFDAEKLDTNIRDIPLGGVRVIVPTSYANMYEHANDLVGTDSSYSDYCFFPIANQRFYEGNEVMEETIYASPHEFAEIINLWDFQLQSYWQPVTAAQVSLDYPSGGPYGVGAQDPKASAFVPFPFVVSILKYIADYLGGYRLTGEWVDDESIKKLCIYNNFALDNIDISFPYFRSDLDINLSNHLPDISVADFITALANMFNLAVNIDSRKRELVINRKGALYSKIAESEYETEPIISIAPPQTTTNDGITYSLDTDDEDTQQDTYRSLQIGANVLDDNDTFPVTDEYGDIRFSPTSYKASIKGAGGFSEKPSAPVYKIGKGVLTKDIQVGTLDTVKNIPIYYSYFDGINPSSPVTYLSGIIPKVKQIGTSSVYGVEGTFSFRVLFYAGMHTDPNGFGDYPIGTSNIYDDNANVILPYSLKWVGGDFALYKAWHQQWQQIQYGKIITVSLIFTIPEYLLFDMTKKLRIGNRIYLIQKMTIEINQNGLTKAKTTCVQIPAL